MPVIALTSASGAPGVTTTAVGWALTRERPTILLDADPTGGSAVLAGYLRGQMTAPDALVELAVAEQHGRLRETLPTVTMPLSGSQVWLVPGTRAHTQAGGLAALWGPLLAAVKSLSGTGQDTVVDLGRLGLTGSAVPFLLGADLTLLACRADLVSLAGARSWAQTLTDQFDQIGARSSFGILLIGPGRPYTKAEAAKVLGAPVVATLGWDPRAAAAFSAGHAPRRLGTSALVTSLRQLEDTVTSTLARTRHELGDTPQEAAS